MVVSRIVFDQDGAREYPRSFLFLRNQKLARTRAAANYGDIPVVAEEYVVAAVADEDAEEDVAGGGGGGGAEEVGVDIFFDGVTC